MDLCIVDRLALEKCLENEGGVVIFSLRKRCGNPYYLSAVVNELSYQVLNRAGVVGTNYSMHLQVSWLFVACSSMVCSSI